MSCSTLARRGGILATALGLVLALVVVPTARAATPADMLAGYSAQAAAPASPERGQRFFNTNHGQDFGWSCASCHTADPTKLGKHAISDKAIAPLAPAANAKRFTDASKVEFHFRLNCKDVVGRECSAGEKADVLSWLLTLKP